MKSYEKQVMSPVWLTFWMLSMSLTWLIPNHFPPWGTFHSDAWISVVAWIGFGWLLYKVKANLRWDLLSLATLCIACLPWVQLETGQIQFFGQAWMSSLYLLGFFLALQMGQRWERFAPGQFALVLFGVFSIAALASVGLQLYTWLGLQGDEITDILSMGLVGNRLYANLGQPNLLASLILWGLLGILLLFERRMVRGSIAVSTAIFLLLGLAFTQSRTGQLSLTLVLVMMLIWRRHWRAPSVTYASTILYFGYWTFPTILEKAHRVLFDGTEGAYSRAIRVNDLRISAWKQFLSATMDRPWFGYGWADVSTAQVEVANKFEPLGTIFAQSHNLFLDIVIWLGYPIGVGVILIIIRLVWSFFASELPVDGRICLLAVSVIGLHAMLEFPLHYALFLIPSGMLLGVLINQQSSLRYLKTMMWPLVAIWGIAGVGLGVTIIDYLHSEESYYALRFEKAKIGVAKTGIGVPPKVIALTQLRDWIWAERLELTRNLTQKELRTLDAIARRYPAGWTIYRVAKAEAINSREDSAQYWIDRVCKFSELSECLALQASWIEESSIFPEMKRISWPAPKAM